MTMPAIGTYWHGAPLNPLQRACLISMMEQGHPVTLFCHEKVGRVPDGIMVVDAKDILGDQRLSVFAETFRKSGRSNLATFSDKFRLLMIERTGWIWLDIDVLLLKPLKPDNDGYLLAWGQGRAINNAVLALPKSSPTLKDMIRFCSDEYPIPPFVSQRKRLKMHIRKRLGRPVHVTNQLWGVWGPRALTYFIGKNNEVHHVSRSDELYPIPDRDLFLGELLLPSAQVQERYLGPAACVHLWHSQSDHLLDRVGWDNVPEGSFLADILRMGT